MKKLVSLITMIAILMSISVSISGCGGNIKSNSHLYFIETNDISQVKNNFEIKVQSIISNQESNFHLFDIYKEEGKLSLIKKVNFNYDNYILPNPRPTNYGFDILSTESIGSIENQSGKIVLDETKYYKYSGITTMFDKSNNLGYACTEDYLYCLKLTKESFQQVWQLDFKNGRICDIPIGNNIVLYNKKDLLVIDTKKVIITQSYRIKESFDIDYVKPVNGDIWVFRIDTIKQKGNDRYIPIHYYTAYLLKTKDAVFKAYRFKETFNYVKAHNNGLIFKSGNDFYSIDDYLNTNHFNINNLHKGANKEFSIFDYSYKIEVDMFDFKYNNKEYILDIDNPLNLREKPKGLTPINWVYRGHGWDYFYRDQGYLIGYDINTQKTTWKIPEQVQDSLPWFSTENGVLVCNLKNGYEYYAYRLK